MKLNVNKNIISGNNLLPFYFLPHALNISLFMIAVVNGQDLPRLPFWICEVTNIFWKIKRFSLSAKCYSVRLVFQSRSLFLNELPEVLFVKREQRTVLVCERALPPVAEHDIKLNLLHHR